MLERLRHRVFGRRADDRGFVIAVFALVLTALLVFAGFSIDVGAWYARGSETQRAADAAALAGVVWMPDIDEARIHARAAAERNGFTPGGNISIDIDPVPSNSRQLTVTITDSNVDQYFSKLVMEDVEITRSATAEYVLPVPLGSPDNQLGGQNNLWASISGQTARHQDGDPYSTRCAGNSCSHTGTVGNSSYRPEGYLYAIEVPDTATSQTLTVELYDAGNYNRYSYWGDWPKEETADYQTSNIQFELFEADNTPLSTSDNLVPAKSLDGRCSSGPGRLAIENGQSSGTYRNQWRTLCRVNVGSLTGQWFLQVKSSQIPGISEGDHTGFNQYAVRADLSGSTDPKVYAVGDMSLFNHVTSDVSGDYDATFYLAEVDQVHAGKSLRIGLYDPGDGQGSGTYYMNILGPGGTTLACTYGPRGGSTTSANPCRIRTRNNSSSTTGIYNDRWLEIDVEIPTSYTCSTDCWWTIRYDFEGLDSGSSPFDRTVWSANIIGDPVHLVD